MNVLLPIRGALPRRSATAAASTIIAAALPLLPLTTTRHASHSEQGAANGPKQGPGKRLGAKKAETEPVVAGNILFRQRGSRWWPGENCVMGRDHTISALTHGFVRYYRDPARHPTRKYSGVVFSQADRLPYPAQAPRRRRLGREPVAMREIARTRGGGGEELGMDLGVDGRPRKRALIVKGMSWLPVQKGSPPALRKEGWRFQETGASLGRTPERIGVVEHGFAANNRWLAWKRRAARKERGAARGLARGKGKKTRRR